MALATHATTPIAAPVAITCHVATWFWAAMEAQQLGRSTAKTALATLQNIAGMNPAPQPAMLAVARSGNWDFARTPATPPDGSVVLWLAGATHSAVVSAAGSITGYNQVVQFPPLHPNVGHTTGLVGQLAANQRVCVVIAEDTIVGLAAALDL